MIATNAEILWTLNKLSERSHKIIHDLSSKKLDSTPDQMALEWAENTVDFYNSLQSKYNK